MRTVLLMAVLSSLISGFVPANGVTTQVHDVRLEKKGIGLQIS